MVNFLSTLRSRRRDKANEEESGNTLVLYLLLFPIIFGVFGLAIDATVATYTQTTLQSGLDTATQSALSRATNPGVDGNTSGRPNLTAEQARNYVINFYDTNRAGQGKNSFVNCQTAITQPGGGGAPIAGAKLVSPPSGCGWTEGEFKFQIYNGQASISNTIVEKSDTVFIGIIGFHEFKYKISAESRITYEIG